MQIKLHVTNRPEECIGSYFCDGFIEVYLTNMFKEFKTEQNIIQAIGETITHELIFHHLTRFEVDDACWGEEHCGDEIKGFMFTWEVEKMIRHCFGNKTLRRLSHVKKKWMR